jgi:hypothetical protein
MIKISKLDSIVSDVRERKIGTLEARVKILDWINKLEVDEAIDLVKSLSLCAVVKPFYCVNKEVGYRDSICLDQCITCGMKEKAQ